MHEVSIVQNILEIAGKEVRKAAATKVEQINLDIGSLAGVEMEALYFAWEACVPDTVLANAERNINHVAAKAKCTACQHEFETEDYFAQCPKCKDFITELIQGKELKIRSLIIS